MVLNRGWSHTTYRYHISSCMWSDTGTVGDGEKLLTHLNSALKVLLGLDIFPRV